MRVWLVCVVVQVMFHNVPVPNNYLCQLTHELMTEPVTAADGMFSLFFRFCFCPLCFVAFSLPFVCLLTCLFRLVLLYLMWCCRLHV